MIHWRFNASGGNSGRGVWVGVGVDEGASVAVGLAVSVRSAAGTNFVGTFAVGVSTPLCVSAKDVLTIGVDWPLPQDASTAARNKKINVLPKMFILPLPLIFMRKRFTLRVCSKDVLYEWGSGW